MQEDFKKVVTSFGSAALVTGAACAAFATGQPIMVGVVSSMLSGIAASMVEKAEYNRLRNLLIKTPPSQLNHDIEQLLAKAVVWTLRNIEYLYKREMRFDFREEKLKRMIEQLIAEVESADIKGLLNHQAVIHQLDGLVSAEGLVEEFFVNAKQLPVIDPDCPFPNFLKENFVPNLQLCFG